MIVTRGSFDPSAPAGAFVNLANYGFDAEMDYVWVSNSDSIDHVIGLGFDDGTNMYPIATANVPAGSGFGTLPPIEMIGHVPSLANTGIYIPSGLGLSVRLNEILTSGLVTFYAQGGSF